MAAARFPILIGYGPITEGARRRDSSFYFGAVARIVSINLGVNNFAHF